MRNVDLCIDRIVLENEVDEGRVIDANRFVEDALRLLGERLENAPKEFWANRDRVIVDDLRVDDVFTKDLRGTQSAAELAEALYQALLRR
jgi:hypothetical protein